MNVDEAREVWQDRGKWLDTVSAFSMYGKKLRSSRTPLIACINFVSKENTWEIKGLGDIESNCITLSKVCGRK